MNQRIHVLRESVTKITRILSGRDIRVTQQGANAYCDYDNDGRPTRVNIPYLPDDASNALINAIQGFLDHEVAHILFTDFKKMSKAGDEGFGSKQNILEDAMIESRMRERFTGSGLNLSNVGKFFLDNFTAPKLKEAMALGSEERVFGVLFPAIARAWAGHSVYKEFMRDKWHLVENHLKIIGDDLAEKAAKMRNTNDTYEVAKEMHRRLSANKPPEPPQPPESGDDSEQFKGQSADSDGESQEDNDQAPGESSQKGDPDDSSEAGQGEGSGDEGEDGDNDKGDEGKGASSDEPESDEDDDEQGEGFGKPEQEDPADDSDGSGSGAGEGEEDDEDDEGESGAAGDDGDGADSGSDGQDDGDDEDDSSSGATAENDGDADEGDEPDNDVQDGEINPEDLSASPVSAEESEEAMEDFDSALSMLLSEETRNTVADAPYSVFTTEYDTVEPWKAPEDVGDHMLNMQSRVDHMLGVIQKDLERAVKAKSHARWVPGQRRGRLNARTLSKLAVGHRHPQIADDRVFRKREEHLNKDVAVSLVVDGSGSMSGEKIRTACDSAYGLASVLERLGIKCEIITFTTRDFPKHVLREVKLDQMNGINWSRHVALNLHIFKGFNESLNSEVKRRLAMYPVFGYGAYNIDGESIEIAARRLIQRPEAGKVMIVLSDGAPNGDGDRYAIRSHAKKVIKDLPKLGINLVGLGICSDAVQAYYKNSIYMRSVSELPTTVIGQLRKMLLQEVS